MTQWAAAKRWRLLVVIVVLAALTAAGLSALRAPQQAVALDPGPSESQLLAARAAAPAPPIETPAAPRRRVVALDPGHGGDELGGLAPELAEHESNLDLSLRMEALLQREGVDVVLTRRSRQRPVLPEQPQDLHKATGAFLDLQARVEIANRADADVFLSVHSNFWDRTRRGLEVWLNMSRPFADQNRELAALLLTNVGDELRLFGSPVPDNGVRDDAILVDTAGNSTPLFVLGPERDISRAEIDEREIDPKAVGLDPWEDSIRTSATQMPGAMVELLYISNSEDLALLLNEGARDALARGVVRALLQFLNAHPGR